MDLLIPEVYLHGSIGKLNRSVVGRWEVGSYIEGVRLSIRCKFTNSPHCFFWLKRLVKRVKEAVSQKRCRNRTVLQQYCESCMI